jgi:hypothetical protein
LPENRVEEFIELHPPNWSTDCARIILPGKRRQRQGADALLGEVEHERKRRVRDSAWESKAHLALHPVHDTLAADIDRESGCILAESLLDLRLPARAWNKIGLVEPNAQARFAGGGARLDARQQGAGGIGIDRGMAEEKSRRALGNTQCK